MNNKKICSLVAFLSHESSAFTVIFVKAVDTSHLLKVCWVFLTHPSFGLLQEMRRDRGSSSQMSVSAKVTF